MSKLMLLVCLLSIFLALTPHVNANTGECSKPASTYSAAKRGVTVLSDSFDHSKDLLTRDRPGECVETLSADVLFFFSREAKENIRMAPKRFTGKTGPLDAKIQNRAMEFIGKYDIPCVACRLDCMEPIPSFGTIFKECENRYYYYGCQKVAPCNALSDGSVIMETAVGICLERSKCTLVDSLADLKKDKERQFRWGRQRRSVRYTPSIDEVKKGVIARVGHFVDNHYRINTRRRRRSFGWAAKYNSKRR